jgi:hypothetical protein
MDEEIFVLLPEIPREYFSRVDDSNIFGSNSS